jgi:putative protein-disulfide isomerase
VIASRQTKPLLYYVHDPMCSWCWGFRPVWQNLQQALTDRLNIRYVLGGLAADSDETMSAEMQSFLQHTWKRIQLEIPGTEFNYDFWQVCTPRRSTWPACRAVIAAKMQHPRYESGMILAIQRAYYLQARNPSDVEVLHQLAAETGLDMKLFMHAFNGAATREILAGEILLSSQLRVSSFPSLVFSWYKEQYAIDVDYHRSNNMIRQIIDIMNA